MAFGNPIIGGNDTLVRNAIQSEDFQSGVQGWRIERSGNAEFADVIVRGSWEVAEGDGYIKGYSFGGEPVIELQPYRGDDPSWSPGYIRARDVSLDHDQGELALLCPAPSGVIDTPYLIMDTEDITIPGSRSTAELKAQDIVLDGDVLADTITAGNIVTGSEGISFTTATSHIRTVNFGVTMPAAPAVVLAIISSGAGVTTGWTVRTDSYTTTQFRLLLAGPSAAWSNVTVRWLAIS